MGVFQCITESVIIKFFYREVGRSDSQICSTAKRIENRVGGATRRRKTQRKNKCKTSATNEKNAGTQASVFRILLVPHPSSKLPKPKLHWFSQNTQKTRQG